MSRSLPLLAGLVGLVLLFMMADRLWISRQSGPADPATASVSPAEIPDLPVLPTVAENAIAVLPFTDLSAADSPSSFSAGLSADLIDLLTRVPGLQVPGRTSAFRFASQGTPIDAIAAALSVAYVLDGSVRRAGQSLRVHARLVRAGDGVVLWDARWDKEAKDVFRIEDDIAGRTAASLQRVLPAARHVPDDRTANLPAYEQYLQGRQLLDRRTDADTRGAIEAFNRATGLDPGYAAAWAGLGAAEDVSGVRGGDRDALDRGLAAASRAIELAPDAPSGYAARALVRLHLWDWTGAAMDFDRARALDPESRLQGERAALAAALGHTEEAIGFAEAAVRDDPLSAREWSRLAGILVGSGRIAAGRAAAHRALDLEPDQSLARLYLSFASLLSGHPDEALPDAQAVGEESLRLAGVALALHSQNIDADSQRALDALVRGYAAVAACQVADVHAWRGDRDQAFAWLDRAVAQHDAGLAYLKLDPFIASLRPDPRYAALLRRLQLPP